MVKIKSPLMSMKASGSIAKFLTFSERKSGSQARWQKKQITNPVSAKQNEVKGLYRLILARWHSFTDNERIDFCYLASLEKQPLSGWNYFFKIAYENPYKELGLSCYYNFDRVVNGKIPDLSKNNIDVVLGPSYPSNSPYLVNSKNSKMNKALFSDMINDTAIIPYNVKFPTYRKMSFCCWLYVNNESSQDVIIFGGASELFNWGPWFEINTTTNLLSLFFYTSKNISVNSSFIIPKKKWVHLGFSVDGVNVRFYFNGVADSLKYLPTLWPLTQKPFELLLFGASECNGCEIDEAVLYNRILPASEFKEIYNQLN